MAVDEPRNRTAYLEEQIRRQQRGEPIDVEWVRAELSRVKAESERKLAASARRVRWLVTGMAALFCVFWIAGNLVNQGDPKLIVPVVVIVSLGAWGLYRRRS
jgi:hypothetical protein